MIESFRMGSGLKDQLINKLFSDSEVVLPQEVEKYLNSQVMNSPCRRLSFEHKLVKLMV